MCILYHNLCLFGFSDSIGWNRLPLNLFAQRMEPRLTGWWKGLPSPDVHPLKVPHKWMSPAAASADTKPSNLGLQLVWLIHLLIFCLQSNHQDYIPISPHWSPATKAVNPWMGALWLTPTTDRGHYNRLNSFRNTVCYQAISSLYCHGGLYDTTMSSMW